MRDIINVISLLCIYNLVYSTTTRCAYTAAGLWLYVIRNVHLVCGVMVVMVVVAAGVLAISLCACLRKFIGWYEGGYFMNVHLCG